MKKIFLLYGLSIMLYFGIIYLLGKYTLHKETPVILIDYRHDRTTSVVYFLWRGDTLIIRRDMEQHKANNDILTCDSPVLKTKPNKYIHLKIKQWKSSLN